MVGVCSMYSVPAPDYLHAGANILLDSGDNIKLVDFGISKQLHVSAAVVPAGLGLVQPIATLINETPSIDMCSSDPSDLSHWFDYQFCKGHVPLDGTRGDFGGDCTDNKG